MNLTTKYRQNQRYIEAYAAYLGECETLGEKVKLAGEIGRLTEQNKHIAQMPLEDARAQIVTYTIQVNAML